MKKAFPLFSTWSANLESFSQHVVCADASVDSRLLEILSASPAARVRQLPVRAVHSEMMLHEKASLRGFFLLKPLFA